MRNTRRIPALLPVLTLVVLICGCGTSEPDGRYEQLVDKTLEQQAAQNQAMAKQSQEVAQKPNRPPTPFGRGSLTYPVFAESVIGRPNHTRRRWVGSER